MSASERAAFINSAQSIVNRSRANTNRTLNKIGYMAQKLKHKNIGKVHLGFGGSKRTGGNDNVMVKHKDGTIQKITPSYRQIANDFLMQLWQAQTISVVSCSMATYRLPMICYRA